MGYGPVVKGKQLPITPYEGSWAQNQELKRLVPKTSSVQCIHGLGFHCKQCWPVDAKKRLVQLQLGG